MLYDCLDINSEGQGFKLLSQVCVSDSYFEVSRREASCTVSSGDDVLRPYQAPSTLLPVQLGTKEKETNLYILLLKVDYEI